MQTQYPGCWSDILESKKGWKVWQNSGYPKGHRALAEVGLGEEDSISPSALIWAAIEGTFGIYTICNPLRYYKKWAIIGG